jgi:hypothetical protein
MEFFVGLQTYQACYMIECGINKEVVVIGCSNDVYVYNQIQVWNSVIKHTEVFCVLLIVHLGIIFVNHQLDAQFFFMYVYFYSLHASGSHVPIIRRINCINMTSGICHSV